MATRAASTRSVLVIGGTRFIGVAIVWRLLAAGHRVTLFSRGSTPDPFGDRVERIRGDRGTEAFEKGLAGRRFDAAVDLLCYRREDAERALAALGGGRVAHYLFVGTGQVYLVREGCPLPARESDYDGPLVPEPAEGRDRDEWRYGAGKRDCEALLVARAAELPATRLRLPMVHGERDPQRRLESYLWRILDGGPLLLPDGGTHRVRHVYAGAVARAVVGLVETREGIGEAYNLCQDETPTLAELLALVAGILGAPPRLVAVSTPTLRDAGLDPRGVSPFSTRWMSFLDPGKAKASLGFRHEPLREYLASIAASFLAHPPASPPENYATRRLEREVARRAGD